MLQRIRLAKQEEIDKIKEFSDLNGGVVFALDTPEGPALAVIRTAVEVDPVIYPEGMSSKMKLIFQRDIETVLSAQGAASYYYNIHTDNQEAIHVAEHSFGAVRTSTAPEFRFKKVL